MKLKSETCMGNGNPSFIGKRQQHMVCSASTVLDFTAKKENEKAGLLIFQSEYNFYYICKSINQGKAVIQLFKGNAKTKSMDLLEQQDLDFSGKLYLQIVANKENYSFSYGSKSNSWKLLKDKIDGKFLSTQMAGGFIGSLFALYATSSGIPSSNSASFKWLDYKGDDAVYH